ncbi:CHASE domain-containing protein [Phaeobacter sp. B1627]|uniref:CHASE domain-containing protein n=1 Tax=Phaeobacter sp. B1627 TaxID=2583809 RepID=UPI0011199676|nr:CHASE domain-containing protein [Phaeobacter sp. B1627]TNJ45112.1 histidine kinase [Phaeobacter sp. B1627]
MVREPEEKRELTSFHIMVVVLSLSMTIGAWLYSRHQVELQIEGRFEAAKARAVGLIEDRMSRYEDALWSGVAFIDANGGQVELEEWRTFAQSLNLEDRYPGVNGIGVIDYVRRENLESYMTHRKLEAREFSVFPQHDHDILLPITFIEPASVNWAAVGLDVAHEINRRTGLLAARDTGTARITGPIVLVQDSGHTPGFLFYTPIYRGERPTTAEERRERFLGVVYAPFVVKKLVAGLLSKDLREVRFSLRDGDELIYDEHDEDEPLHDDDPMFTDRVEIEMYGRIWTVEVKTNLAFRSNNGSDLPTFILVGGLIIEILVITMLALLSRSNRKARLYANKLTKELRAKSDTLEKANAEIEQFVYVASHDLKTPVRGIGFLTDVIEEDLTEILGPLDKHPEITTQLGMIRDRVNRMNDLTRGIMDFSRVSHGAEASAPELSVRNLIDDCIADFKVTPAQVRVESEVATIGYDSLHFRRVLENLIGNAVKYHPNPQKALVDVVIEDQQDKLRVLVKDNGKGIAPKFHDRIFDVFQTLRSGDQKESTGIGLAIVKKAVERHGYHIFLKSSEGHGAEFTFFWPTGRELDAMNVDKVA